MALGGIQSSGAAGQNPSVLCWFLAGDHSQGFSVVVFALFLFVCCDFFGHMSLSSPSSFIEVYE